MGWKGNVTVSEKKTNLLSLPGIEPQFLSLQSAAYLLTDYAVSARIK
jgi:hypothetical protein